MGENQSTYIARTSGLKAKDYFGYALVDVAGCLVFSLVTSILQKYYTDVFHLSPLFIMFMFIGARVWDAINDPIMGRICDVTKPSKSGKYRRWFLYVSIPLPITAILMFVKWNGLGGDVNYLGTCIYATITYVLFGMVYTMLQIPYGSLANVVTTDSTERNKLSVYRSIGAAFGSIPIFVLVSFIYEKRVDEAGNFVVGENGKIITDMQYKPVMIGVIVMALCSALMLVASYLLNKERVVLKQVEHQKGATKQAMKNLFTNRSFMSISLVSMFLLAGQMFTQSFYLYLFNDYFNANWMNLASQACTYSPMLIFMFCLPKLARKLGKKEISQYGVLFAALANLTLFFLRNVTPEKLMILFLVMCFISGVGLTTIVMQLWSMAADAIDEVEVTTGSKDDGTAYSFFNFFRKIGQVVAAICVNGALLGMNYKYEKGAVQTYENLRKMYNLATLIPAIMFGIMALILFVWYPLSKKKVDELQVLKEAKLKESFEKQLIDIQ